MILILFLQCIATVVHVIIKLLQKQAPDIRRRIEWQESVLSLAMLWSVFLFLLSGLHLS